VTAPKIERRDTDRRSREDTRVEHMTVAVERRKSDRRLGIERRLALQSAAGQLQTALGLLLQVADSASLNDDERRMLDTAMLRLRFAVERMASE
jgi:hypothetical protein